MYVVNVIILLGFQKEINKFNSYLFCFNFKRVDKLIFKNYCIFTKKISI